jgi:putative FmdB family regulatory protein
LPLYEYKCLKCDRHTDRIEKLAGPFLKKCPHCNGKVERVMAPSAIQFKGSGWYATDYAAKKTAPSDGSKADTPAATDAGKSESKTKEAPATEKKPAKE